MGRLAYAENGGSTGVAGLHEGMVVGLVEEVEPGVYEAAVDWGPSPGTSRFHALSLEFCEEHLLTENPASDAPPGTFAREGPRRDLPVYETPDCEGVTELTIRLRRESARHAAAGGRPGTDER
jgi:hypothetical protein